MPAVIPISLLWTSPLFQLYVYPPNPPLAPNPPVVVSVIEPLEPPLQSGSEVVPVRLMGGDMVTVWLNVSGQPEMSVIINVTLNVPVPEKVWVGFCLLEVSFSPVDGSPKFHLQLWTSATLDVDISVNCTGRTHDW